MRTKEDGLLTTADVALVVHVEMRLRAAAHGGDSLASGQCRACKAMEMVLGWWLGAHTADAEELDRLEAELADSEGASPIGFGR